MVIFNSKLLVYQGVTYAREQQCEAEAQDQSGTQRGAQASGRPLPAGRKGASHLGAVHQSMVVFPPVIENDHL